MGSGHSQALAFSQAKFILTGHILSQKESSLGKGESWGVGSGFTGGGAIPGFWNSQSTEIKADEERAVSNLESTPKESSWGQS